MTHKKILILIAILFTAITFTNAQTSDRGFSFQGYATNPDGVALISTAITVRFTLSPGTFTEEHSLITDAYGIFHAIIGNSSVAKSAEFSKLDFTKKGVNYTLKVEVKKTSGGVYTTIINNEPLKAVPYARYAANGVPVGTIVAYGGDKNNVPEGWLLCDGASVLQSDYPQLFAIIGSAWGTSGSSFNLPDLRGRFLRGVDDGSNNDPDVSSRTAINAGGNTGNNVGTLQGDATARPNNNFTTDEQGSHTHSYNDPRGNDANHDADWVSTFSPSKTNEYYALRQTGASGAHSHTVSGGGDNETRPANAAVYYIIKY